MNWLTRVRSWLKWIVKRRQLETDMEAEALFHMENRAEDRARTGVPRQEAMSRARIEFGGVESHFSLADALVFRPLSVSRPGET
jgi:hypothetical protein